MRISFEKVRFNLYSKMKITQECKYFCLLRVIKIKISKSILHWIILHCKKAHATDPFSFFTLLRARTHHNCKASKASVREHQSVRDNEPQTNVQQNMILICWLWQTEAGLNQLTIPCTLICFCTNHPLALMCTYCMNYYFSSNKTNNTTACLCHSIHSTYHRSPTRIIWWAWATEEHRSLPPESLKVSSKEWERQREGGRERQEGEKDKSDKQGLYTDVTGWTSREEGGAVDEQRVWFVRSVETGTEWAVSSDIAFLRLLGEKDAWGTTTSS